MIQTDKAGEALEAYRTGYFPKRWVHESYKWRAVKTFQENWDPNAPDFPDMLERSLSETHWLLASTHFFPRPVILLLAKAVPEEVRSMFNGLFDETQDVYERIQAFKSRASALYERHRDGNPAHTQHFQNENAVTTYLFLRYPEKYCIYRYTEARAVSKIMAPECWLRPGAYPGNLQSAFQMYSELQDVISEDTELVSLVRSGLTEEHWPDPSLIVLTTDVVNYIGRFYSRGNPTGEPRNRKDEDRDGEGSLPATPAPDPESGLTIKHWSRLLQDRSVFPPDSLTILACLRDMAEPASFEDLAARYGRIPDFYREGAISLARRVCEAIGMEGETEESTAALSVLYTSKGPVDQEPTDNEESGGPTWKLKDALLQALDRADLSGVRLYEEAEETRD